MVMETAKSDPSMNQPPPLQNLFIALALLAVSSGAHADTFYVANAGTNKIMQFTSAGVGSTFADTSSGSWGVAFDSAGNVYDYDGCRLCGRRG